MYPAYVVALKNGSCRLSQFSAYCSKSVSYTHLESILDQKINVPVEVLLIDDGSTDGCADLCDRYAARDARVRVIHQENQGLSAARNAGIDAAKGRYYSFIDSDDVVLPGFLQTLYDACERHDRCV